MKLTNYIRTLGPGILFASTAIGVSHLVQSTRAGAEFGLGLLGVVVLTNILKYPFFEFGSRFANATGSSLIEGYNSIGRWVLWLYLMITLSSMFFVTAAVGFVTTGFFDHLFGLSENFGMSSDLSALILFFLCAAILVIGKYSTLDKTIKIVGTVLLVSTLVAFVLTLNNGPIVEFKQLIPDDVFEKKNLPFIIALMGWMPTAVDLSTWNSIWTVERVKQTGYKPTLKETLIDFNLGYIISGVLAICFITMGAFMMFGSDESLPSAAYLFAGEVVRLFTQTIGDWSFWLIAVSAFSIMFGTAIAVFDGYSRALGECLSLIINTKKRRKINSNKVYNYSLFILVVGAYLIIFQFLGNLKALVDLAMIVSFIIAPVIAILNYILVSGRYVDPFYHPKLWLKVLSYLGISFLLLFVITYFLI